MLYGFPTGPTLLFPLSPSPRVSGFQTKANCTFLFERDRSRPPAGGSCAQTPDPRRSPVGCCLLGAQRGTSEQALRSVCSNDRRLLAQVVAPALRTAGSPPSPR